MTHERILPRPVGWLSDVDLTGLVDGAALTWDGVAKRWVPGSVASPEWHHESFVVPTTPPTTFTTALAPLTTGSLMLGLTSGSSGRLLDEGNDYTVDYTTGAITVTASLAAGDVLVTRYQTPAGTVAVPISVADLAFWWRAGSLGLSDGNAVSSWTDEGPNAYSALQASSTLRPIYHSAPTGFNGKPAVQFDGVDDFLQVGYDAGLNPANMTIFIVGQLATLTGSQMFLASHDQSAGNTGYDMYAGNGTGSSSFRVRSVANGTVSASTAPGAGSLTAGTTYILGATDDGTTAIGYNNGTVEQTNGSGKLDVNTSAAAYIGKDPNFGAGTVFLNGFIAEIICYSRVLTTSERNQVEAYLSTKYAI